MKAIHLSIVRLFRRQPAELLAMLIIGAHLCFSSLAFADAEKTTDTLGLVGSWRATLIPDPNPRFPTATLHTLVTFTVDGGALQSHAVPSVSTGHGAWLQTHRGDLLPPAYTASLLSLQRDDKDDLIGTEQHLLTLNLLSSDEFEGQYQHQVLDANGSLLSSQAGTVQGKRIRVEPQQAELLGGQQTDTALLGLQPLAKQLSPACVEESLGGGGVQITCKSGGVRCVCVYPKGQAGSCVCGGAL